MVDCSAYDLKLLLREALPLIERAATEEARANRATRGLRPAITKRRDLYDRVQAALKEG